MRRTIATVTIATATGILLSTAAYAQIIGHDLKGFDKIDISTGLDARIVQGDTFAVATESRDRDALDKVILEVKDGVLTARIEQNFLDFILNGGMVGLLLSSGNAVTVHVIMPDLTAVTGSSGADIEVHDMTIPNLTVTSSSGADIELTGMVLGQAILSASSGAEIDISGTASAVEADASSGSDIDAGALITANATAKASSGASLSIHATTSIAADASSGGSIDVSGNPAQRQVDTSSGGDISFDD